MPEIVLPSGGGGAMTCNLAGQTVLPYIGTYASGTTYALGDAVRADNGGTWQLYISLVASNLGNDPTASPSQWKDVVSDAIPVYVWGTVNPNTVGEQTSITEYDNGAPTGGTFDLGTATGIAWDVLQATFQAALDAEYGAGVAVVSDDALWVPYTVTYYGTPLVLDGTNLTGGGATSQTTTQAFDSGGFTASQGSVYYYTGAAPNIYVWDGVTSLFWTSNRTVATSGLGAFPAYADDIVTNASEGTSDARGSKTTERSGVGAGDAQGNIFASRSGDGDGNAEAAFQVGRTGAGDGYAYASMFSERGGSGVGDSTAAMSAIISGSAVGAATSGQTATHHTGGSMQVELSADSAGAYAKLIGTLPTSDPAVSGQIWEFAGDIAALTTYLAGGGTLLVRSP